MTRRSCWLALVALLLTVVTSEGQSPCSSAVPAPPTEEAMPPCTGSPVLSKVPYINRLFRNDSSECESQCSDKKAVCPCKEEVKDGCCCEKEKGDCPCKKTKAVEKKTCPVGGPCCGTACCPPAPAVCYPVMGTNPACAAVPPPPMPPMAYAPCGPMPCPPNMMSIYPQAAYMAPPAPPVVKRYLVEVRVVESNPGEKDAVVAAPKVVVTEGSAGHVSFVPPDVTVSEQVKLMVENNIYVIVRSAKPGWAYVDVAVEEIDREKTGKKGSGLVEYTGSIHIARKIKLGKKVKVPWKQAPDDDKPVCRVEVKVKELPAPKNPSVVYDCPYGPGYFPVCPPPAPACWEAPMPCPVAQAAYCAPASVSPVTAAKCRTVKFTCADLGNVLRYATSENDLVTLTQKTDVEMPGCGKVKFYAAGNKVRVRGGAFKASADCVEACSDGNLRLEGHVRVKCTECDCGADLRADKVHVLLKDGKVKIDLDTCQPKH